MEPFNVHKPTIAIVKIASSIVDVTGAYVAYVSTGGYAAYSRIRLETYAAIRTNLQEAIVRVVSVTDSCRLD